MKNLIYSYVFGVLLLSLTMVGCSSGGRRSDLGVLKKETRSELGQYKADH